MTAKSIDPQITRPDILVPDTSPLIHLSQAGALNLLHEIGGTVIIVDMVYFELTRDLDKPEARALQAWVLEGQKEGSNTPVRLEKTETGRIFELARQTDSHVRMKDGGETAIVQWLAETVDATNYQTIVIYENGKVPSMIANRNMDIDIDVLTTRAFLELAEQRNLVKSAQDVWAKIVQAAPQTNPKIEAFVRRRSSK
jgi:predicted nucleic acid-binding protein